ncbi:MAG: carbamate kinase [Candidatus Lindowbacteria bacterium RIFCSPLOWO2_12_FULL_62_27]|nr:MAG: carbamate kinase [Candidatus Lindowbacteria bacterium RIFCSPLOWO2_02_FULL_62_12]OGH59297.1 MAG: carbamate kinase [Candidatus Lindowbacteria bacterium RIFCSPLOWO2_12_FULL_62_27]
MAVHGPLVIALGGNAITRPGQIGTIPEQYQATRETCEHIVTLIERGHTVLITHGNGPQVGNVLRRVECARDEVYPLPLDVCVADTEGGMGYMIQQCMQNALMNRTVRRSIITVITQMVVSPDDPAFQNPTKPIGPFMGVEEAEARRKMDHWQVVEDAGRGYRRVVPSPRPKRIIEINAIRSLIREQCIVIACGGGGIPVVVNSDGDIRGVEGVIDKDLASALLAGDIGAPTLIISTGTEKVALHYKKPNQVLLDRLSAAEARRHLAEGHFPPGSMGPKIEAAVEFLQRGGREVIITTPDQIANALDGKTGTRILP